VEEKFGKDNVYYVERPRKNKYIYFNARGKRRKELKQKLKYKIYPYPKGDTQKHDPNEKYGY
jgi:hypothetical protein